MALAHARVALGSLTSSAALRRMRCRPYYAKTFDYAVTPAQNLSDYKGILRSFASTGGIWQERWDIGVPINSVAGAYTGAAVTTYSADAASSEPYNETAPGTWGGGAVVSVIGGTSIDMQETSAAGGDADDRIALHATLEAEF